MTSKLKYEVYCPFCGEGLLFWGATGSMRKCPKCDNNLLGNKEIWQALIQAKQDLEILKQALEKYADEDMWETCDIWEVEYIQSMFLEHGYKIAKEALEQIDHIADTNKGQKK